jgi:hypothetical protein
MHPIPDSLGDHDFQQPADLVSIAGRMVVRMGLLMQKPDTSGIRYMELVRHE